MCGRAMCKIDPKILMKIFGCKQIKNQERYRPTYNAGPFKHLPVAYMRPKTLPKHEAKLLEEQQDREDEEAKDAGFVPNYDDEESENEQESPKIGKKRKIDQIENDAKLPDYEHIKSSKEINEEHGMN